MNVLEIAGILFFIAIGIISLNSIVIYHYKLKMYKKQATCKHEYHLDDDIRTGMHEHCTKCGHQKY